MPTAVPVLTTGGHWQRVNPPRRAVFGGREHPGPAPNRQARRLSPRLPAADPRRPVVGPDPKGRVGGATGRVAPPTTGPAPTPEDPQQVLLWDDFPDRAEPGRRRPTLNVGRRPVGPRRRGPAAPTFHAEGPSARCPRGPSSTGTWPVRSVPWRRPATSRRRPRGQTNPLGLPVGKETEGGVAPAPAPLSKGHRPRAALPCSPPPRVRVRGLRRGMPFVRCAPAFPPPAGEGVTFQVRLLTSRPAFSRRPGGQQHAAAAGRRHPGLKTPAGPRTPHLSGGATWHTRST